MSFALLHRIKTQFKYNAQTTREILRLFHIRQFNLKYVRSSPVLLHLRLSLPQPMTIDNLIRGL